MKQCIRCKISRGNNEFYKNTSYKSGRDNTCVICRRKVDRREYYKEYYSQRKEEKRQERKKLYNKNKEKYLLKWKNYRHTYNGYITTMYSSMRNRCKKNNRKLMFSFEEFKNFMEKEKYTYNNLRRIWIKNNYRRKFAPTIDRINGKKHYSLNNIQLLSFRENVRKSNRYERQKTR